MTPSNREFRPDWVSPPGETILDILTEKGLPIREFADRLGESPADTRDLLEGRATITIGTARLLVQILGASVEFWMARDFQYRQDAARLQNTDQEWLAKLPVGDMIRYGWLNPKPSPLDEFSACLRFFDVANVRAWRRAYSGLLESAAYRTSPSFDSNPSAVAAWLRQGEITAKAIDCGGWEPETLRKSLSSIRALTWKKDPGQFVPELQKLCAKSGVAVVVVRSPAGCRASGAVRFLSPTRPILQLSLRYLSDDHFWFTFFHEAGHLLLHGDSSIFLEGLEDLREPLLARAEQEANDFAARTIIPDEFRQEFLSLDADHRKVIRFARNAGIAPGIVVGQLQYYKKIKPNQLNRLKRRYSWKG